MIRLKKIFFIVFTLLSFSFGAQAQSYSLLDAMCIDIDGEELINPFVGGLNSPQFNLVDFDLDGEEDLVLMDRDGEIVLPYRYKDGVYIYSPEYRSNFPNLKKWVRFVDYNADGVKDIYCYNIESPIDGVEIYRGSIIDGKLAYTKIIPTPGEPFEIIYFSLGVQTVNLDLSSTDLPDVLDVDGDGDVDIITFQGDDPFVKFFRNTCVENGVSLEMPQYELADGCWGKFRENGVNESIKLSENISMCADPLVGDSDDTKNNVHAGSTITLYDDDADGDFEAIIGDLSNENMNWLHNESVGGESFMTEIDSVFPFYDSPIDIFIFNAAFVLDIDKDGNDDLVAAPNFTGAIQNRNNVWYYKNAASDGQHDFQLQNTNFLGDEMFDFGSLSNPTSCDFNQDGKKDLLVGVFGEFVIGDNPDSKLYLFENISEGDDIAFKLIDEDYEGFLAYKSLFFNYAPSFGDLDNDGDDDLMVSTNTGELIYLENTAGEGNPYEFASPVFEYGGIDVGDNAKVQLVDLNRDGLLDIIIGERNQNADPNDEDAQGNINYFENIGSIGNPQFNADEDVLPNTPALGHVVTRDITTIKGSATPYFYDTGDSFLLYVGSESGKVKLYNNIEGNFYSGFTEVDDDVQSLYSGKRSAICVDDFNNDGLLEFAVGNIRGGVTLFGSDLLTNGLVNIYKELREDINIYPNPASDVLNIEENEIYHSYEIIRIDGSSIKAGNVETGNNAISLTGLNEGIYVLLLKNDTRISSKRFTIIR